MGLLVAVALLLFSNFSRIFGKLISIFGKNFLENWKSNDNFFNFQENISKTRKLNVCP